MSELHQVCPYYSTASSDSFQSIVIIEPDIHLVAGCD